ncbi:MAG: accessory Sec system translocase SecA2 [Fibrobacterota bacterium]
MTNKSWEASSCTAGVSRKCRPGRGKTVAAVFPACLNALVGKGVHVLTFNDYLARRDAHWMGPIYAFLGLRVGRVQEGMPVAVRQQAYSSDITYLTAKEAGFDYLRDNLCYADTDRVHRAFHFAVVDEADSILIDEARVPLIIAEAANNSPASESDAVLRMAGIARALVQPRDFDTDEYARNIHLTEAGARRVEAVLGCGSLYDEENHATLALLHSALHAAHLLHRDRDYLVRDGKVELVDEFTGRVADKRRWPDGLQAALEAKEDLWVRAKGSLLNSITLQHFLRLYPRLCGMTATARAAEREFTEFYRLPVTVIPPHAPCVREDRPDALYRTREARREALVSEIEQAHSVQRPVLVGTGSVEESADLAAALRVRGVDCEVLNAKDDEFEARIIAQAGRAGAVTVSTNMAGRGTDIRLGNGDEKEKKQVVALGGLYVIGTHRHESRRIDDQLRGRAGRQGDPGVTRFFLSLEDELFVRYRLRDLVPAGRMENLSGDTIHDRWVYHEINRVQRIVEGQNLEIKLTLFKYSSLIEEQRKIITAQRNAALSGDSALQLFEENASGHFRQLMERQGRDGVLSLCRDLSLFCLDKAWSRYLADITEIRENIHWKRMGGQDPLFEFHKMAIDLFGQMLVESEADAMEMFLRISPDRGRADLDSLGVKAPSSTWTYLVNDNPFEDLLSLKLIGDSGFSVGAGLWWPLLVVFSFLKKRNWKKGTG